MYSYFYIGMNAALRAVVRTGIYLGCKVYLIHEVNLILPKMNWNLKELILFKSRDTKEWLTEPKT